jgi:O-antigen/teichoic acid export membrane protein
LSAVKHSFGNLATKLAIYPISFISSIIVARVLGPEQRGVFNYLLISVTFIIPIFSFGFGSGVIYYVSSKKYLPKDIFYSVVLISVIISSTICLLLLLLKQLNLLGTIGNQLGVFEFTGLLLCIILNFIFFFLTRILIGVSNFKNINLLTLFQGLLNPILLLILVGFFGMKLYGAVISMVVVNILATVSIIFIFLKNYNLVNKFDFDFVKDTFSYGIKSWLGDVAIQANVRLDQVVLGAISKPSSLGIYSISVFLAELLWLIPDAVGPVLFNKITGIKSIEGQENLTKRISRILLFIGTVSSFFLIIFVCYIIIPFGYGDEYSESIVPFLILIPGTICYILAKVITKILSGTGNIAMTSKATVSGSIISILFYIILIPRFDIVGAAIASSIGYISISLICLYFFKYKLKLTLKNLFVISKEDLIWMYSFKEKLSIKNI